MSQLEKVFQNIKKYPNGEKVAIRLTQLWDLAIVEDDSTIPERVMQVIEAHEEKLLQRSQWDMFENKPALPNFRQALKDSTDEEWRVFKKEHNILPLEKPDRERLFVDGSGLVRGIGFELWVLGEAIPAADVEKQLIVHRVIHLDKKGKE